MTASREQIRAKLRAYMLENFLFTENDAELDDGTSFLEAGILDSTGIMEVMLFVEEEFALTVADDEMVPSNLDSVSQLVEFIQRKVAA